MPSGYVTCDSKHLGTDRVGCTLVSLYLPGAVREHQQDPNWEHTLQGWLVTV